jgi:hypothetical protein
MVLDGPEGQEGGSADVMERKERYWMRFLKGMVTDHNSLGLSESRGMEGEGSWSSTMERIGTSLAM